MINMKVYNNIAELIGHTPLLKLNKLIEKLDLHADLYAKLEMFNPAGSIKDRAALGMIQDAFAKGAISKGSTIIEPTSGNTGIGLALVARVYGLNLILTMPDSMSVERQNLLKARGAQLVLTPGNMGMKGAVDEAERIKEKTPGSIIVGQFYNSANPKSHEETTAKEIFNDLDGQLDYVIAGVGTGGTISGIAHGLKKLKEDKEILRLKLMEMRRLILRGIGIPISIGVAPTLTLAKVANNFAKKYDGYKGVCFIDDDEKRLKALQLLPIEDVWGVGRHNVERLKVCGIRTAFDLTRKNELWINNILNINGVRMWKELKGESCIGVNELPGKKSICTSRSFGNLISDWDNLCESVVNFVVSCAEKLRRQHSVCKILTVFIMTSRFRADLPQYNNSVNIALPVATADTSELVKYAVLGLRSIYKGGYLYKKSGVVVSGISSDSAIEQDLFDFVDRSKQRSIINAIDTINSKHSKGALSLASQGVTQGHWGLKREYFSRCYSTNFNDIIEVKI